MRAFHTGHKIITFSQQPSQQDWESRGQLVPLLEQVTQHSQGQSQCNRSVHLAEGKFCGNEREGSGECVAQGQPREAPQDSGNGQGLRSNHCHRPAGRRLG